MNQVIELNRGLKNIQCGFRRNRNTEDVMLMFMNDAVYALENKKVLLMAFLDVVSAFDSMVHRHILEAIMAAAVKGQLLEFSDSFLEGREVKIKVGSTRLDYQSENTKYDAALEVVLVAGVGDNNFFQNVIPMIKY
ncbi:hypothetical protein QYM36_003820 [Artemia franciscana]|uniref:Reverse transcriptase domain-containing protein n=1 Tax=Artemia franciscana TaxID=6661 RepID=A0AA88LEC2_ARTSF|nr:hypothetical protein QYM36_003820 [Artemia franciscana]